MTCGGTTRSGQTRLNAVSPSWAIMWGTAFMDCTGMDEAFVVLMAMAASSSDFEAQLVIQTADVRASNPNAPVAKGTVQTPTNGSFAYGLSLDLTNDTADAALIRFGVQYRYASGQAPAGADVEMEVSHIQCGKIAGSLTTQLSTTTTADQVIAVTDFLPGLQVQKVKGIAICSSLTGNLQWRLAYRVAATSKDSPGAWQVLTDASAPYGAGEVNTGELAITVGSNMWVQLGALYNLSAAGSGQATLSIAIGIRRS